MACLTMETEVSCELRFIFLTLDFRNLFADLKKLLAINRNMLSLLVSHTMYRNLHKCFINILTNHLKQYSSGYDPRFPRTDCGSKHSLAIIFYFLLLLFSVCICCFSFYLFFYFLSLRVRRSQKLILV